MAKSKMRDRGCLRGVGSPGGLSGVFMSRDVYCVGFTEPAKG